MPVLRTQTAGMACGAEGSTGGSTRPSGRSLQTNLGDGRTQRCVSVWAFWTGACEGPGSRRVVPRLVLTHRFSWVQWSKGCKTLTSYRLEGPVLSRPSPVGLRSLLARRGHPLPSLWWSGCRDTWEVAGWTESHSRVWWYGGANETGWGALAKPPRTVLVTPTDVPAVGQRGGTQGPGSGVSLPVRSGVGVCDALTCVPAEGAWVVRLTALSNRPQLPTGERGGWV